MRSTTDIMSYKIDVVIEKDEDGYYAYCPAFKGCHTQGDTFEEVQANIKEAIDLYLATLSDRYIAQRREEIAADAKEALQLFHEGKLKSHPVEEIIAELRQSLDNQNSQNPDQRSVLLNQAGVFADDETLREIQAQIDLDRRTNLVGDD